MGWNDNVLSTEDAGALHASVRRAGPARGADPVRSRDVARRRNRRLLRPRLLRGPRTVRRLVDSLVPRGFRLPDCAELRAPGLRRREHCAAAGDGPVLRPRHGACRGLLHGDQPAGRLAGGRRDGPVHGRVWLLRLRHPARPVDSRPNVVFRPARADPGRDRADLRPHPGSRSRVVDHRTGHIRWPDHVRFPAPPALPGPDLGTGHRGVDLPGRTERIPVLPQDLRRPRLAETGQTRAFSAEVPGSVVSPADPGNPGSRLACRPAPASAPVAEIAAATRSAARTPWLTAAGEAKLPTAANTAEAIAIPKAPPT